MKNLKLIFFLFVLLTIYTKPVSASEGLVELKSQTNESFKCFASSMLMQDLNFLIAITCRDLLYSSDNRVSEYVLWSMPTSNAKPIRLVELDLGRKEVKTKIPFSELYITFEERIPGQKDPSETIVMRGSVRPITFLDRPGTPTPTPEGIADPVKDNVSNLSFGNKVIEAFKRAGIALFLFVIVGVGLVFVVLKSKG